MNKSKEEDDLAINSEQIENEEKSVSEKIKKNIRNGSPIVINASFTRRTKDEEDENLNDDQKQADLKSVISNGIYSALEINRQDSNYFTQFSLNDARSVYSNTSNFPQQLTSNNSLQRYPHHVNSTEKLTNLSPWKVPRPSNGKGSNNLSNLKTPEKEQNEEELEVKKLSSMLKSKEKELKEMLTTYDTLSQKFAEKNKVYNRNKEHLERIRTNNFNMKILICQMIKIKPLK